MTDSRPGPGEPLAPEALALPGDLWDADPSADAMHPGDGRPLAVSSADPLESAFPGDDGFLAVPPSGPVKSILVADDESLGVAAGDARSLDSTFWSDGGPPSSEASVWGGGSSPAATAELRLPSAPRGEADADAAPDQLGSASPASDGSPVVADPESLDSTFWSDREKAGDPLESSLANDGGFLAVPPPERLESSSSGDASVLAAPDSPFVDALSAPVGSDADLPPIDPDLPPFHVDVVDSSFWGDVGADSSASEPADGDLVLAPAWSDPGPDEQDHGLADDLTLPPAPLDAPDLRSDVIGLGTATHDVERSERWNRFRGSIAQPQVKGAAVTLVVAAAVLVGVLKGDAPSSDVIQSGPITTRPASPRSAAPTTTTPAMPSPVSAVPAAADADSAPPAGPSQAAPRPAGVGSAPSGADPAPNGRDVSPAPARPPRQFAPVSEPAPDPAPAPAWTPPPPSQVYIAPPQVASENPPRVEPEPSPPRPRPTPAPATTAPPAPKPEPAPKDKNKLPCFEEIERGRLACPPSDGS